MLNNYDRIHITYDKKYIIFYFYLAQTISYHFIIIMYNEAYNKLYCYF